MWGSLSGHSNFLQKESAQLVYDWRESLDPVVGFRTLTCSRPWIWCRSCGMTFSQRQASRSRRASPRANWWPNWPLRVAPLLFGEMRWPEHIWWDGEVISPIGKPWSQAQVRIASNKSCVVVRSGRFLVLLHFGKSTASKVCQASCPSWHQWSWKICAALGQLTCLSGGATCTNYPAQPRSSLMVHMKCEMLRFNYKCATGAMQPLFSMDSTADDAIPTYHQNKSRQRSTLQLMDTNTPRLWTAQNMNEHEKSTLMVLQETRLLHTLFTALLNAKVGHEALGAVFREAAQRTHRPHWASKLLGAAQTIWYW